MIQGSCLDAYADLYPEDSIFYLEPGELVCIESGEKSYIQPQTETGAVFMERLSRCTKQNNLFLNDWPEYVGDPEKVY